MKFVALASTFAALAALGDATTSLRGGSKRSDDHSALESRVTMKGVIGEPSAEDLKLLGKALVASYNDVHWELGYSLLSGFEITESLGQCGHLCSDDDSKKSQLSVSIVTPVKVHQCGHLCSDDDSNNLLTTPIKQCGHLCSDDDSAMGVDHALLETAFCNKIKSSGSKFWMDANECSIVIDAPESKKVTVVDNSSSPIVLESHVILHGVLEEASKEDAAIISKALVSSFNALNWESQYSMSAVQIPFQVAIPEAAADCHPHLLCPDATAKQKALYVTVVTPLKDPSCGPRCKDDGSARILEELGQCGHLCSDDDSAALSARKELEAAFCEKIKSSTSMNLKSANKCSIVTVAETTN